jgi:hypothetical protein
MSGTDTSTGRRRSPNAKEKLAASLLESWRMPENTVKVDRSTKWGNPFTLEGARKVGYRGTDAELRALCVDSFRKWLDGRVQPELEEDRRAYILAHIDQLRGHDLACWCPLDQPCHADVLLQLANAPIDERGRAV